MKVEIDNAFAVAFAATWGVIFAFGLFILVSDLILKEDTNSKAIRANCAHHHGVDHIDSGTTFMDGETFVTCRDGWYERVDN
jgi:hypothetical protein